MNFRLQIKIGDQSHQINHQQKILMIGSCFSINIGNKLKESKFDIDTNPFGISYNPISISKQLNILLNNYHLNNSYIVNYNEQWHSIMHHGSFSNIDKNTTLTNINNRIQNGHEQLKSADWLVITLGTAYAYTYLESHQVVNNCHKIPAKKFSRKLYSSEEITQAFTPILDEIKSINKNLKILFTVSPIRHIKDGLSNNNLSKAQLITAVNSLVNTNENCYYFPAYEIMIDELRDYRFYKSDMVHPNDLAISYIWQQFAKSFFNGTTQKLISQIDEINNAMNHRPFNPNSEAHQKFKLSMTSKVEQIQTVYSHLDFSNELKYFTI